MPFYSRGIATVPHEEKRSLLDSGRQVLSNSVQSILTATISIANRVTFRSSALLRRAETGAASSEQQEDLVPLTPITETLEHISADTILMYGLRPSEFSSDEAAHIEEHLATCRQCRIQVEEGRARTDYFEALLRQGYCD